MRKGVRGVRRDGVRSYTIEPYPDTRRRANQIKVTVQPSEVRQSGNRTCDASGRQKVLFTRRKEERQLLRSEPLTQKKHKQESDGDRANILPDDWSYYC